VAQRVRHEPLGDARLVCRVHEPLVDRPVLLVLPAAVARHQRAVRKVLDHVPHPGRNGNVAELAALALLERSRVRAVAGGLLVNAQDRSVLPNAGLLFVIVGSGSVPHLVMVTTPGSHASPLRKIV